MPRIDGARLIADQRRLARFGAFRTGVDRPTFSPQDVEARRWFAAKLAEIGLDPVIDGVGNVFGRSSAPGRKLLMGSHLESQREAGWLDGALGAVAALEVARAMREDPACRDLPVEVVGWADEESHFITYLGSRSYIGDIAEAAIDAAADRTDGRPLRTALAEAGLAGVPRAAIDPERYVGYLESHIEQGGELDETGLSLGIVTSIVGIWQYRIVFEGQQNHAGTTRMAVRKDAGVALTELCGAIARRFPKVAGPRSVWTTGRITLEPGAPAIVPGKAEMIFQFRDAEPDILAAMGAALEDLVRQSDARGPCRARLTRLSASIPQRMDERFRAALGEAAERHAPGKHVAMPSGAGHDAQILARKIPAAMLFVPSIGGISHHWTEDTAEADIVLGCQVLADAAETILRRYA